MDIFANIFNIQHFSLNDGPGIRTVVFFKGCPLNCAWCHNPESKSKKPELSFIEKRCFMCGKCLEVCKEKVHTFENNSHILNRDKCTLCGKCVKACENSALEILGEKYKICDIIKEIEKDDVFFSSDGGVTISGGEPFMQFEALYALLKALKEKGYHTCIETSGYTLKENILKAAEYTDIFLFDIKETSNELHKKYIGANKDLILKNLDALSESSSKVILRCPIIPSINERVEHFENIARLAEKYDNVKSVELMSYHPLGIEKSRQIGKASPYSEKNFADKEKIKNYAKEMKCITSKPIKVN